MTLAECLQSARDIAADTIRAGLNGDLPHRAALSLLADIEEACKPETDLTGCLASWIRADITNLDHWRNSAISMGRPDRAEFYRRIIDIRKAASAAIEGAQTVFLQRWDQPPLEMPRILHCFRDEVEVPAPK